MVDKLELQKALNGLTGLTRANATGHKWRNVIIEYSMDTWGVMPGDVDCDFFIDAVDNGCGVPCGMTAKEFITAMKNCINKNQLYNIENQ